MGVARFLARGILLRCPNCGRGRIYAMFLRANHACADCGRVYQRDPGDWTGGAEMTLLLALPFAVLVLFLLTAYTDLGPTTRVALVMASVAVTLPLAYRHVKGLWLGILRAWEGPDPKPSPIQDPEWFTAFWDDEARAKR